MTYKRTTTKSELARQVKGLDNQETDTAIGVHVAEVTNVNDPLRLGRIKVRLEYQKKDEETNWIPPKGGFQYNGYGSSFDIPAVGDKVRIEFMAGNIHNMMYTGGWYHEAAQADLTKADAANTPRGRGDATYEASKGKRRNIFRTLSGWFFDLIEGKDILEEWDMYLQSPSGRDSLLWRTPNHKDTGKRFGEWQAIIDAYLTFKDTTDGTAEFSYDAVERIIGSRIHKNGKLVFGDHSGGSVTWDDTFATINIAIPSDMTPPKANTLTLTDPKGGSLFINGKESDWIFTAMNLMSLSGKTVIISASEKMNISSVKLDISGLDISVTGAEVSINGASVKIQGVEVTAKMLLWLKGASGG